MVDRLARTLIKDEGIVLVGCLATGAARRAREVHGLAPSSAALLAQGLTAAAMMAAFQKVAKIDLQVAGDGPAGSLFADADPSGNVRGYVRNKSVNFPSTGRFSTAPLLGGEGFLSVLRDIDGRFYRGMVELESGELERELERYFSISEQLESAVGLEVIPSADDALGWVGGVIAQKLPDGDAAALARLRETLRKGAVADAGRAGLNSPFALCEAIAGGRPLELLADQPIGFVCRCSRERVLRALATLPPSELESMIAEDHGAVATCDFCMSRYEITEAELGDVLQSVKSQAGGGDGAA